MKIFGIIFSLLLTLISAAVFGGFPRGMFPVHKSFSKLMSDVVSNVRQNIDCSIRSMQSVLDNGSPLPYDSRCNEHANQRITNTNSKQHVKTAAPDSIKFVPVKQNFTSTTESPKTDGPLVNKTIIDIISNQMAQKKLDEINNVLKNETEQLNNVNDLLKQKIDTISKDVNEGLKKIEQDHKEPRIEDVIHEIELLREQKQNDSSKVDQVREIAKEVLNKLNKNDTTSNDTTSLKISELMKTVRDLEQYSNNTLREIARQFKDWETVESDQLNTIKNILERQQSDNENEKNNKPLSIKDISKNIFDGKSVYSNHTDSEATTDKGAESTNTSQILKNPSVKVTTINSITYDPISLSANQIGSNIINSSTDNNSTNLLTTEPYQKEKYTITEKSISSETDFIRNKNTETKITSTEKGGTPELLNAEHRINLDIHTGQKLLAINSSVLLDKEKHTSTESTHYKNIQDNVNDLVTDSITTVANLSDVPGNVGSVERQAVTEIVSQITLINDTNIHINSSTNTGNITDVSNISHFVTEGFLSTNQYYLNDTNTTTESVYRSTDIVEAPNKMNLSYNIDNKPEPNNVTTIKSDISYVSSMDQTITTESFLSTKEIEAKNDVANKSEPVNTFMNTDDMPTMLSVEKYVVTENSLSTNKINTTEIVENGSEFMNTSTSMGDTLGVTTEHFDSTIIINQIDNYIPTTTESVNPSTYTDYMLVDTPDALGEENFVTTENSFESNIESNYNILERNESIYTPIKYDDTATDITTAEHNMATDNIVENNLAQKLDLNRGNTGTLEFATEEHLVTTENLISTTVVNSFTDISKEIYSKINISTNMGINITDDIEVSTTEEIVSSKKPYIDDKVSSNINISNNVNTLSTSTNAYLLGIGSNLSSEIMNHTTDLGDDIKQKTESSENVPNNLNVENQQTAKNYHTVNTSTSIANVLSDMTDEPNTNILLTSENYHFAQNIYSNDNIVEKSESIDTIDASSEEIIRSTNRAEPFNSIFNENDLITTSTNKNAIFNFSDVEDFATSEKPYTTNAIKNNNNFDENVTLKSTSTNAELPNIEEKRTTEYSTSTLLYSNDDINEKNESFDDISERSGDQNLETAEYFATTNLINVDSNNPTETVYSSTPTDNVLVSASGLPSIDISESTEDYPSPGEINAIDETVEGRELMGTSTYKGGLIDVSSEEIPHPTNRMKPLNSFSNEFIDTSTTITDKINMSNEKVLGTSEKPPTTNEIKINNNIYKNVVTISTPTNAELLQMPDIEEQLTTESSTSTIYSNDDVNENNEIFDDISEENLETTQYNPTTNLINVDFNNPTETVYSSTSTDNVLVSASGLPSIDISESTEDYNSPDKMNSNGATVEKSEFIDSPIYTDGTRDRSNEEDVVTTENLISTNHKVVNDAISDEYDSIETSTSTEDTEELSSVNDFVTLERPYTMNVIRSNYDISEEIKSAESNEDDALEVSKETNLMTSHYSSTKSININSDEHSESIDTYGASSPELTATPKYYHSKEHFISKTITDTNTESTDILSNTPEYRRLKKNSYKKATTESPTSTLCPDELKLLPKGKSRDQAVKLALNIFEQSRRSQSIMKNVFKNEKYGTSIF